MHYSEPGAGGGVLPLTPLAHQLPSANTDAAQLWASAAATAAAAAACSSNNPARSNTSPGDSATPRIPPATSPIPARRNDTSSNHLADITYSEALYEDNSNAIRQPAMALASRQTCPSPAAVHGSAGHAASFQPYTNAPQPQTHASDALVASRTSSLWGSESVVIDMPGAVQSTQEHGLWFGRSSSRGSILGADRGDGRSSAGSRRSTAPSAVVDHPAFRGSSNSLRVSPSQRVIGRGALPAAGLAAGSAAAAAAADSAARTSAVSAHQARQAGFVPGSTASSIGCGASGAAPAPLHSDAAAAAARYAVSCGGASAARPTTETVSSDDAALLPRTATSGGDGGDDLAAGGSRNSRSPAEPSGWSRWLRALWPWGRNGDAREGAGGDGRAARKKKKKSSQPEFLPAAVHRRLTRAYGRNVSHMHTWDQLAMWLVPEGKGKYPALWTLTYIIIAVSAYMCMVGQYPVFQLVQQQSGSRAWFEALQQLSYGPSQMTPWINPSMRGTPTNSFGWDFMLTWGAKYNPSIYAGEWWRWVTSLLLHQNFNHILSNLVLFVFLSGIMEHEYGTLLVFGVFIISGFAANFSSSIFESACLLVVGVSGAVFGLIGLFIADIIINWETMILPWFRLGGIVVLLIFMVVMQVTDKTLSGSISYASHVGGGLTGLTAALLLLPNIKDKRFRALEALAEKLGFTDHLQAMLRRLHKKQQRKGRGQQGGGADGDGSPRSGVQGQQASESLQLQGHEGGEVEEQGLGRRGKHSGAATERWGSGDSLAGDETRRTEEYVGADGAGVAARAQQHLQHPATVGAALAPEQPSAPPLTAAKAGTNTAPARKGGAVRSTSGADLKVAADDQRRTAASTAATAAVADASSGVVWVVDPETGIRMPQPCAPALKGQTADWPSADAEPAVPVVGVAGRTGKAGAVVSEVQVAADAAACEAVDGCSRGQSRRSRRRGSATPEPVVTRGDDEQLVSPEAVAEEERLNVKARLRGGSWWRRHTWGWVLWITVATLSVLYLLLALLVQPLYIYYVVFPRISCPS